MISDERFWFVGSIISYFPVPIPLEGVFDSIEAKRWVRRRLKDSINGCQAMARTGSTTIRIDFIIGLSDPHTRSKRFREGSTSVVFTME